LPSPVFEYFKALMLRHAAPPKASVIAHNKQQAKSTGIVNVPGKQGPDGVGSRKEGLEASTVRRDGTSGTVTGAPVTGARELGESKGAQGHPDVLEARRHAEALEAQGHPDAVKARRHAEALEAQIHADALEAQGHPDAAEARSRADALESQLRAGTEGKALSGSTMPPKGADAGTMEATATNAHGAGDLRQDLEEVKEPALVFVRSDTDMSDARYSPEPPKAEDYMDDEDEDLYDNTKLREARMAKDRAAQEEAAKKAEEMRKSENAALAERQGKLAGMSAAAQGILSKYS
jgi:hypothetical protein